MKSVWLVRTVLPVKMVSSAQEAVLEAVSKSSQRTLLATIRLSTLKVVKAPLGEVVVAQVVVS